MTLVRIIKNWDWPDLMQQTPGHKGIWDGIRFTLEPVEECDYVIVSNCASEETIVQCPPQHIWAIMQEPPDDRATHIHRGNVVYHRIYTQDIALCGNRYIYSQPILPWHLNKNYDYLTSCGTPSKERRLSWITSNLALTRGHLVRLRFFERINGQIKFDLFGRGFNPITDKWDGLAPYRYSLAIESFSNPYYWSEKLADCFLTWTMPIYYGCTRITDYFPAEAIIQIDINSPDIVDQIESAISEDRWSRSLDAIAYARELILNKYQFFPFMAWQIRQFESCYGSLFKKQVISIPPCPSVSTTQRILHRLTRLWDDIFHKINIINRINLNCRFI